MCVVPFLPNSASTVVDTMQGSHVVLTTYTGLLCMVIWAGSAIKCICVVSVSKSGGKSAQVDEFQRCLLQQF